MLGLFKWIILGDEIYIIYILVNSNHGKRPTIKIQPSDFAAKVSAAPVDSQRKNVGQTSCLEFMHQLLNSQNDNVLLSTNNLLNISFSYFFLSYLYFITPLNKPKSTISIISSVGGRDWMKSQYGLHESTDQNKYIKI